MKILNRGKSVQLAGGGEGHRKGEKYVPKSEAEEQYDISVWYDMGGSMTWGCSKI